MAAVLDQSNTTTNGSVILRRSDATVNNRWGQSFTCGTTGTLDSISISLSKSGSPTGNLKIELYGGDATSPTGSVLSTSANLDVSTVSASQTEYTLNFSNDYTMVSGTRYWLVISSNTTPSNTVCINIWYNNTSSLANEKNNRADDTTWQNDQNGDLYFKDYLIPVITSGFFNFF